MCIRDRLRNARHPLLQQTLRAQGKQVVPLDLQLDKRRHIPVSYTHLLILGNYKVVSLRRDRSAVVTFPGEVVFALTDRVVVTRRCV